MHRRLVPVLLICFMAGLSLRLDAQEKSTTNYTGKKTAYIIGPINVRKLLSKEFPQHSYWNQAVDRCIYIIDSPPKYGLNHPHLILSQSEEKALLRLKQAQISDTNVFLKSLDDPVSIGKCVTLELTFTTHNGQANDVIALQINVSLRWSTDGECKFFSFRRLDGYELAGVQVFRSLKK